MNWLYKLQNKYSRFGIYDLMKYIVIAQAIVYFADIFMQDLNLYYMFSLNMPLVLRGEIWRLVTFLFIPPNEGLIFTAISLYFYYILGSALESEWGTFIFNVYYFIGALACIISALLTGYASNQFLNLSIFFAFAILFPDFEILLIFLPIKIKYLAYLDALLYLIQFLKGGASTRVTIILCLANLFIFFGKDFIDRIKKEASYQKTRRSFRQQNSGNNYWR